MSYQGALSAQKMMKVTFEDCVNDGSSFSGPFSFEVDLETNQWVVTTINSSGESIIERADLSIKCPAIQAARKVAPSDIAMIFKNLSKQGRATVESDMYNIDAESARMLEFADGRKGFVIVLDGPSFVNLKVGNDTFEIDMFESEVKAYTPGK